MSVDAEERIHNTIESEAVAKNMANREVGYYNAMAFLTGGKGIASSNTSNSNNGGLNSQMQSNWNEKYNTNTNNLLNQNTILANNVKSEDKLYSTHFDKNGKAEFINDGDYNAYRKNDDGSLNYENQITYAEGFNLNIADDKKEAFENQMKTNEVQADLYRMYLLGGGDANWANGLPKSFSEALTSTNAFEIFKDFDMYIQGKKSTISLEVKNTEQINNFIKIGADDYTLNHLFASNLWLTIADNSNINTGKVNPTKTMTNTFETSLDITRPFINPAIGNYPRESTGCGTTGCGEFGALRDSGGRTHNGVDIMTRIGDYIVAGGDGTLQNTSTTDKKTGIKLPGINVTTDNGIIQTLYTQSGNKVDKNNKPISIRDNTSVNQGNIIGKQVNIKKNPTYQNTPNHTHTEIFETYINTENGRKKVNQQDPTNILFPNKTKVKIGLPNVNNK